MRDDPTQFVGSIPSFYDKGLGPVIFAGPADYVARRIAALKPSRVLETAGGTGIVTQRLRAALSTDAHIVATDLNAGMLEISRAKFGPDAGVSLEVADATALPFGDGEFDVVVCQFGVMFFPDKDKGYREARRVLKREGRYLFSVWDAHAHNPFGRIISDVLRNAFDTDAPPFMNVPFGYASIDAIKASLQANGFGELRADVVRLSGPLEDFNFFADGLVFGSPVVDQLRARGVDPEKLKSEVVKSLQNELGAVKSTPLQFVLFEASPA